MHQLLHASLRVLKLSLCVVVAEVVELRESCKKIIMAMAFQKTLPDLPEWLQLRALNPSAA